jgi:shikimate kinase/3-dehydroquinate synthase
MPQPIFLVGFMAAGKTTVGRMAAAHLGRRFVDLDDVITADAGRSVASWVASDEDSFRRQEAESLRALIAGAQDGPVIATGGGCAAYSGNLEVMGRAGLVIALSVSLPEVRSRARGGSPRPLLAGDDDSLRELMAAREPSYRQAHVRVDTEQRSAEAVAALVSEIAGRNEVMGHPGGVVTWLGLPGRAYPVVTSLAEFDASAVRRVLPAVTRLAVITDDVVAVHWATAVCSALSAQGFTTTIHSVAAGEHSKSMTTYAGLCEELVAAGLDRGSAIVALGGGVVGDLAGFVASTLFRGMPWVGVPTTLLAMIDSAIGGKTAIDLPAGKNLVGSFWQPSAVLSHLPLLATLPPRQRRAAFGELWKYAMLIGDSLWKQVEAIADHAAAPVGAAAPSGLFEVVAAAARFKAWIISGDETETRGERVGLNLGHTVGHAIEAEAGLLHGEAVGLGLVAACRISRALTIGDPSLEQEVLAALRVTGLPADLGAYLTEGALDRLQFDKKRRGDRVTFVAPKQLGQCELIDVPLTDLVSILRSARAVG